jgi:hypothetical protein
MTTSTFTAKKFKEMMNARPFQPFRVTTADGKSLEVPGHDAALVTQHFLRVGIAFNADGIAQRCANCPIFHVTNVEFMEAEKTETVKKAKKAKKAR